VSLNAAYICKYTVIRIAIFCCATAKQGALLIACVRSSVRPSVRLSRAADGVLN